MGSMAERLGPCATPEVLCHLIAIGSPGHDLPEVVGSAANSNGANLLGKVNHQVND
jgi:hypothetical protein